MLEVTVAFGFPVLMVQALRASAQQKADIAYVLSFIIPPHLLEIIVLLLFGVEIL